MPKQKTKKTVKKRFKITKSGKILRGHQYAGHRRSHKSKRRIRTYKKPLELSAKQSLEIKKLLGK